MQLFINTPGSYLHVKDEMFEIRFRRRPVGIVPSPRSRRRTTQGLYKAGLDDGVRTFKEFRLPSGRRVDFLDLEKGIVYELKPFNPRAMEMGRQQLRRYVRELRSPAFLERYTQLRGISWKMVLDVY